MGKVVDTQRFIAMAREVHGERYNYAQVDYKNTKTKVPIVCAVHGVFHQRPNSHLSGTGCPRCASSLPLTLEEFLKRATKVHGSFYNYSEVVYKNMKTYITIICPKHGKFKQSPHVHLRGHDCPECGKEKHKEHIHRHLARLKKG